MKTIVTDIPDYKTFLRGEKTVEIGYPWLTFGAIMALEKILDDSLGTFSILESGCGGSTVFFAKRCKQILSIEHDIKWVLHAMEKLERLKIFNFIPTDPETLSHLEGLFDMVLVDGGANWKERQKLLDLLYLRVKKGGWLIIDNYEHVKFDYTGWDVYTFDMFRYSGRGTKLCKKL